MIKTQQRKGPESNPNFLTRSVQWIRLDLLTYALSFPRCVPVEHGNVELAIAPRATETEAQVAVTIREHLIASPNQPGLHGGRISVKVGDCNLQRVIGLLTQYFVHLVNGPSMFHLGIVRPGTEYRLDFVIGNRFALGKPRGVLQCITYLLFGVALGLMYTL